MVNEVADLTIRRDRTYYRLQLTIKEDKINNLSLSAFIDNFNALDTNNLFNYDFSNKRYYAYGSKVIELLELIYSNYCYILLDFKLNEKVSKLLDNKELFTRSSGKKLTEEELTRLEQLHKELN